MTKENAVLSRGQGMRGRAGVGNDWVTLMNSVFTKLAGLKGLLSRRAQWVLALGPKLR